MWRIKDNKVITYGNRGMTLEYDINNILNNEFNRKFLQEKIVKKGNKYQVQSEKGRNLGTYDTKEEAEKRLNQVEHFKSLDESKSIKTSDNKTSVKLFDYDWLEEEK